MPYDPDSLDLFFILLGDGSIYLIPTSVLAGRVQIIRELHPATGWGTRQVCLA